MLLPVKWLSDYIDIDFLSVRELSDGLTLSGSHVESIMTLGNEIDKVVVGRILEINKHENADKLVVCKIDVGEELQIVTGADNIKVGDLVPVALVGARLAGNFKIKKSKLRGVESYGMLCSLEELGYSENVIASQYRDGIYIIKEDVEVGKDIREVLSMMDGVLEIEVTPNRPDCLSIIGLARETAASFHKKLKLPKVTIEKEEDNIEDYLEAVNIETEKCNRYYARVIKDVTIEESPIWLQSRLMDAGIRPINNIVDLTNFVMLEYGQPLHAFDLDELSGKEIYVRQAKKDETIETLDGKTRKLDEEDIVIADDKEAIGIAGVMGGLDSEITPKTKTVILESANFDGKSIRLTSNKFGLRSEASSRYEKEIDAKICKEAGDRFCQLVELISAGKVVAGNIDIYKKPSEEISIELRPEKVNKHLGTNISQDKMVEYLLDLGLEVKKLEKKLEVIIPTFRQDLKEEVDLIEEIGRLYGFHKIKPQPLRARLTRGVKPRFRIIEDKSKEILSGLGLSEILTYSFISPRDYDLIKVKEDSELRKYASLLNPLGQDYSIMRTTLISNMMATLSRNYNRKVESAFFYEIGNIFKPKEIPVVDIPKEKRTLILGGYGKDLNFFAIKEVLNILLAKIGLRDIKYLREEKDPTFHPGRTARLEYLGEEIGIVGEIHPDVTDNYNIKEKVYIAQIDYDKVIERASLRVEYRELPKYPAMERDIALVLDEEILSSDVEEIVKKHAKDLLESISIFDIYKGDQIPEGKKSVAYTIVYRAMDRTLTDEEVNKIQEELIGDLEKSLAAKLRS